MYAVARLNAEDVEGRVLEVMGVERLRGRA